VILHITMYKIAHCGIIHITLERLENGYMLSIHLCSSKIEKGREVDMNLSFSEV